MMQYLLILLDDTSVAFCHNGNERKQRRLIPLDTLKAGVLYGMKENLNIQFVYPDYELPADYHEAIETIDHTKIKPATLAEGADIVVLDGLSDVDAFVPVAGVVYVLRLFKDELFSGVLP